MQQGIQRAGEDHPEEQEAAEQGAQAPGVIPEEVPATEPGNSSI